MLFSLQWEEEASKMFCTRQQHNNIFGYNDRNENKARLTQKWENSCGIWPLDGVVVQLQRRRSAVIQQLQLQTLQLPQTEESV